MSEAHAAEIVADVVPSEVAAERPAHAMPVASGGYLLPWQPGKSGNPTGRSRRFHEVTMLAQEKSVQAIEKLSVLMDCGDERVEIMAANAILDRAFGKPKEVKQDDSAQQRPDLSKLSPESLAALRRAMVELASLSAPVTE